jgi:hypothetical protein
MVRCGRLWKDKFGMTHVGRLFNGHLRSSPISTPYWDHITDPKQGYKERIITMLSRYPIDHPGKEFIIRPDVAVDLTKELETLGIAVWAVTVWCYVPPNVHQSDCCPDGYGGPSRQTPDGMEWFSEYVHLGYSVPGFYEGEIPRNLDLAAHCNPLVRQYLQEQLPQVRGYNSNFRVSIDLFIPDEWDLFANPS